MYRHDELEHLKKLEQKGRDRIEAEQKEQQEQQLFDIEVRRDKRERRHWIWNLANTLIALAALAVSVFSLVK